MKNLLRKLLRALTTRKERTYSEIYRVGHHHAWVRSIGDPMKEVIWGVGLKWR